MHVYTHREKYSETGSHKRWAASPLGKRGTEVKRDREIETERQIHTELGI